MQIVASWHPGSENSRGHFSIYLNMNRQGLKQMLNNVCKEEYSLAASTERGLAEIDLRSSQDFARVVTALAKKC